MRYSQADGLTQPVAVGVWFKRVLTGNDAPADMLAELAGSRYFAQFAPNLPLSVARPSELPATSLTMAFVATTDQAVAGRAPHVLENLPEPDVIPIGGGCPTVG